MEQCKGACFTSSVLTARTTVRLQNTVVSLTCKMQTAGAAEEGLLENCKRMTRRLFILGADGSSLGTRKGAKSRAQECYHNAQANHRLGWKGLGLASITELQHNAPIVARPFKSSTRVLPGTIRSSRIICSRILSPAILSTQNSRKQFTQSRPTMAWNEACRCSSTRSFPVLTL